MTISPFVFLYAHADKSTEPTVLPSVAVEAGGAVEEEASHEVVVEQLLTKTHPKMAKLRSRREPPKLRRS